ncbi:response regulator transcription factor [Priestia megaterium]|uniref:response regulator transcription factor n=1 Tax=Priestia megaterium TaxID=1404 RepID=UPI000D5061CC|nr:response regulator transcription factor [Priestia megaterium]PVE72660.1 DNA-binding response regulator [Priestia megaterium]PVE89449.1 DNA-binding response regulator [Priestia megaterium]PVE93139.1 DNA-binding response regulator [Priestia megaterium]PVF00384.1 DNA-binding response regulator [Priestia megaterium]RMA91191.1 two-component system response regulator CssR [Priestia megaterium]
MSFTLYLVEDEQNLNEVLTLYLQKEGWDVRSFFNGTDAKEMIATPPHLWILDIMLPDIDGYQLIREIKQQTPQVPVIFISARDADIDRVLGLEMGSDDYLSKPFLPRELVIRANKLLNRVYGSNQKKTDTITLTPYEIDLHTRTVSENGKSIDLTSKEFDFLVTISKDLGQAFSREQLLNLIWGEDYFGTDRVVDDLVRRVRKKMPQARIETIYGYGYRMMKA